MTVAAEVRIDPAKVRRLMLALREEADGKALRRDLNAGLRAAAEPGLAAVKVAILSMPSEEKGKPPSLRASIAQRIRIHVRSTGKQAGVSLQAHSTGLPRGFRKAPRFLNSAKPWRHPVFGNRDIWVAQISRRPGWWSETLKPLRAPAAVVVHEALEQVARRVAAKTKG